MAPCKRAREECQPEHQQAAPTRSYVPFLSNFICRQQWRPQLVQQVLPIDVIHATRYTLHATRYTQCKSVALKTPDYTQKHAQS